MKYLLEKVKENPEKFSSCLLEFRNTPNISGRSPAQMFFCRRLRSQLPHLPGSNDLDISNALIGAKQRKHHMENPESKPAIPLPTLDIGQRVLIQTPPSKSWDQKGHITAIRPRDRSYHVEFDSGKTSVRNRKFLRPIVNEVPMASASDYDNGFSQDENQEPRRSARIAKNKSITFGKNSVHLIPK